MTAAEFRQRLETKSRFVRRHQPGNRRVTFGRRGDRPYFPAGRDYGRQTHLNAGRGVGMSIVKEAVESRGGWITIDSEPQRGTTFIIRMPATFATVRPDPKAERVSELRVLIVADSASIRQMTTQGRRKSRMEGLHRKGRDSTR